MSGLFFGWCLFGVVRVYNGPMHGGYKVRVYAYFLSPFILNAMGGFEDCMLLRAQSICQNLGFFAIIECLRVANKPNVRRICCFNKSRVAK